MVILNNCAPSWSLASKSDGLFFKFSLICWNVSSFQIFRWPEHQKMCKSSERLHIHWSPSLCTCPGQEKFSFLFICLPNAVNAILSRSHELSSIQEKQPRLTLPWCNYGPKHTQSLWSRSKHQLKHSGSLVFKPDIIKFQVQEPSPAHHLPERRRCSFAPVQNNGSSGVFLRYWLWHNKIWVLYSRLSLEKIELATSWFGEKLRWLFSTAVSQEQGSYDTTAIHHIWVVCRKKAQMYSAKYSAC